MDIIQTLNQIAASLSTADLLVIAGILATGIQYLANKYVNFRKFTNQLLGLLIPFLIVAPTWIASQKEIAVYGSLIYVISQTIYYVVEKLKASAVAKATVEQAQF